MTLSKKQKQQMLLLEYRVLRVAFASGLVAALCFLVCFSTDHWVAVQFARGVFRNDLGREAPYYKTGHYHGLWTICRVEYRNDSGVPQPQESSYCRQMYFTRPNNNIGPQQDSTPQKMLDFRRSTVAVGFICIILSLFANFFVFYSLNQMRYMFKRLAGLLALIAGASAWVTLEVFRQSVHFENMHMTGKEGFQSIDFGWSYNLIWFVLALYVFDGVVMLACSRKRKGVKARSLKEARENEPVYLGRI